MIEEIDLIANKLNEYSFEKLNEHLEEILDTISQRR